MSNPTKPKRPKSRYAQKRAGTITHGYPGAQRPLLEGLRLVALQCTCGRNPVTGRADSMWICGSCVRIAAVLDGDKLANAGAVALAREAGARVFCVHLVAPALAAERRKARGTKQNETWVKGRATKARRFFEAFEGPGFECLPSTAAIPAIRKGVR